MRLIPFATVLVLACSAFATDSGALYDPPEVAAIGIDAYGDSCITTMFASDNNFAGNSFDIVAKWPMHIVGWDCNLAQVVPSFTIDIYWREGTANGFELTYIGWNHLGQDAVVPAGVDLPTHVDIAMQDWMVPGDTVGIIITAQEAVSGVGGFNYTNGGPTMFSNSHLDIITYRGLAAGWPPLSTFTYRQWNGTVHYDYWMPMLARTTWASIKSLDF